MNLEQFDKQFANLKGAEKIMVDELCNHPQHITAGKDIGKTAARRNILKHGGDEFICRACDMKHNNPVAKSGQGRRQTDEMIDVFCPGSCGKTRKMKMACYYGAMEEPYKQLCGSCVQKGKVVPEERRKKISKTLTGRTLSEEHIKNILKFRENNPEWAKKANSNLEPGKGRGWNKGQETPEEVRKKQSEAMSGVKKTKSHRKNISIGRKKMLDAQGGLLPETKEKLSKATLKQYTRGFQPAMHHRRGEYFSEKMQKAMWYKSSYELKAFMKLDADDNVVSYEYEPLSIEYIKPGTNYNSNYLIDLKVIYVDGTVELIEVKPLKRTYGELESAKATAALTFAEDRDYTFRIWTEDDLFESQQELRGFVQDLDQENKHEY